MRLTIRPGHTVRTFCAIGLILAAGAGPEVAPGSEPIQETPDQRSPESAAPAKEEITDEYVAKKLGITPLQVRRLHKERALSRERLLTIPPKKLQRALWRLEYPKPSMPDEATRFRRSRHHDESGSYPVHALLNAVQSKVERQAVVRRRGVNRVAGLPVWKDAPGPRWEWIGPTNWGGRTRAMLIHPVEPNRMWAASISGGMWTSTNAGDNWEPLDGFLPNMIICCLAAHPDNPDVIFAGTGEGFFMHYAFQGAGIFYTVDGGDQWYHLESTSGSEQFRFVSGLAVLPGNRLVAATHTNLWFAELPPGKPTKIEKPLAWYSYEGTEGDWLEFAVDPRGTGHWLAAGRGRVYYYLPETKRQGFARGIPKKTAKSPNGGRIALAISAAQPGLVYASVDHNSGQLYRSTDYGQNFSLVNSGVSYMGNQGWYNNTIWAGDPSNENLVVVGGIDLWRSVDGGETLTRISDYTNSHSAHADHHIIVSHPAYNGTSNRVVYFGTDGGIYRTDDVLNVKPGEGWINLNTNYGCTQFYHAAGAAKDGKIVAIIGGTQDNGTLRYTPENGPTKWTSIFPGDGGFCAVDPDDPDYVYGQYPNLKIFRSTDGGADPKNPRWIIHGLTDANHITASGVAQSDANFVAPFVLDPNDSNTMLAGGMRLWRSNNVKASDPTKVAWHVIKEASDDYISAIDIREGPLGSDIVWVGHNDGEIFRTRNGTAPQPTWTRLDPDRTGLPERFCTRIVIDDKRPGVVYITFGGYERQNVWRTIDGGDNWRTVWGNATPAPVYDLTVHPNNAQCIYVATEIGLFVSENDGENWYPATDGPTTSPIDEVFFLGTTLVAATHGRGVYTIDLGGVGARPPAVKPTPDPRITTLQKKIAELTEELGNVQKALAKIQAQLKKVSDPGNEEGETQEEK